MDAWRGKLGQRRRRSAGQRDRAPNGCVSMADGSIDELFGYWDNFNHRISKWKIPPSRWFASRAGRWGKSWSATRRNPGSMARSTSMAQMAHRLAYKPKAGSLCSRRNHRGRPPFNDVWTVAGEEGILPTGKIRSSVCARPRYHELLSLPANRRHVGRHAGRREPMVNGDDGRMSVELFTAIYRSQRDQGPIKFPLQAEAD